MPTPHGPSVSAPVERVRLQPSALLFRLYKAVLSPVLHTAAPSRCLYLPTCSEYAYTAVSRFGFFRGSWLAARRLLRCHPWAKGGLDPVPEHLHAPPNNPGAAPDCASQRGPNHLP